MSARDEFNRKMCIELTDSRYDHLFSVPKKGFHRFLNDLSFTQLND